ncbi:Spherulin-4 [Phanerochaete sordida]|uniref:Spherulin-4 n=1 Tax=Phanerochaete sordida TaxID=48140 RepID=A0A9P3FW63_9APHY|nr:Spherulin-4 [Phanerochaete sordida]
MAAVAGTGILVPLYIYPGDAPTCSAWQPLLNAIHANPFVPFTVIVNPDSGPGGAPGAQPDASYQGCVPLLAAHANVRTVGYVPTHYGARSAADVDADIGAYAGWDAAYAPEGIFFDEVEPTSEFLALYTSFAGTARASFAGGDGLVFLNPGASVQDDGFFAIADQIVTAEDYYSDFSPSQLSLRSSSPASKQAVILHDAPSSPPTSLLSQLVSDGIGSLYISDDTQANNGNPYDSFPSDLSSLAAALGADS